MRSQLTIFFLLLLFASAAKGQELPVKNKSIVAFCESNKGKKIGKGECWDLAKFALNNAGAVWEPPYSFGKEVMIKKKEIVLAGDVIQFENVKIVNADKSWQQIPHHTAIIFKVLGEGKYMLAEQNSNNKRFVTFSGIDLNNIKKGKYSIYRPQ